MKVCFVTTSFIRSEKDHYARFVYEQAKSLTRLDEPCSVSVVAPHAGGLARRESIDSVDIIRARYFLPERLQRLAYQHEGLFETLKKSPLALLQLPLLLVSLAVRLFSASKGAALIHAQWVPTAAVALFVARLRGIPVIASVRGADLNTAAGSATGRAFTRLILNRVSHIVTVSDEFRAQLRGALEITTPVDSLYNGVDTEQFRPRPAESKDVPRASDKFVVLFVGGLIRRKGVDTLLEAARPLSNVEILIAGEGPERAALEQFADSHSMRDRVRFVGKIDRTDMHDWMQSADALVLPSASEGRPNVVLEALACGLPVLATDIPGTRELIEDRKNGLLFEVGDAGQLREKILTLADDPALAARMSSAGPETIARHRLSWREHGKQLADIYRSSMEPR